ncbi:expressed hypothetical protein [Trichoplax adhaerens]|uniref:Enoyl reductase (ER) domain-containing protein n=1 Tax=Trichoplax adhaerens TaxID=10228 RepID=B3S6Q1_TRIAD|nr:expressed hypothetical protein [Trichoplax adhaerens]EDV21799.1 expressed hypothetical protein [Trichoplax adhaerens]|eukprot:XP_002115947.1 expressed hypothetical protein [Trichoplax adhaerens]
MPDSMSFEEGAAIPVNYLTTYVMLFNFGNLQEGQSVLCHMAAGGVGYAVGQLCRTVPKVTLYGTCSAGKHEGAKENGYTHLIDYRTQDYVNEIRKLEPEGIDLVLDPLGGTENKRNYDLTKTFGRQIVYGSANIVTGGSRSLMSIAKTWWNTSGRSPLDLMADNKMVGGVHLGHLFTGYYKKILPPAFSDIVRWYNDGIVKPKIDSVHAFEDFTDAFRRIHERKNVGKVLFSPTKSPNSK